MPERSLEWWDPIFWQENRPHSHFDTPSTLCAPLLAGIFRSWQEKFALTGVVEIGAGDGRILDEYARAGDLSYLGVDIREQPDGQPWPWVSARWDSAAEEWVGPEFLAERPLLVTAVEWLDDLPAPVAEIAGAHPLAIVPDGGTSELSTADRAWLKRWWPAGSRAVVGRPRDRAWEWLARRLAPGSVLATIDYGHTLADRPADGGLTAHLAGHQVAPGPGVNVTAGIAVDSLAAAVEDAGAQRLWCTRLADLPPDFWPIAGSGLNQLSLRSQEALLRDPERFGGFWLIAHQIPMVER